MPRRDLPPGTVLLGAKAHQVYTDPDTKMSFFFIQKDFGDDQFICVIENNTTGKALAFILMHGEIQPFLDRVKAEGQRDRRLDILRDFTKDHSPFRPVEVTENKYRLGEWE